MVDTVMTVKDASPCARCGGEMYLDTFDGDRGTLKCRGCGHSFEVKVGSAVEKGAEDDE